MFGVCRQRDGMLPHGRREGAVSNEIVKFFQQFVLERDGRLFVPLRKEGERLLRKTRFDERDGVVRIGDVRLFQPFGEAVPFDDAAEGDFGAFAFPGGVRAAVVVGEHEIVREVVHEAAARNEADEEDHADDDGELTPCQRGLLPEEPQQRVADEHKKDDRS